MAEANEIRRANDAAANETAEAIPGEEEVVDAVIAYLDEMAFGNLLIKSLLLPIFLLGVAAIVKSFAVMAMRYLPVLVKTIFS